jgi:hypothetical protein
MTTTLLRTHRRPAWAASAVPTRKRWTMIHRDPEGTIVAETVSMWMTARAWREYQEAYPEETTWQAMPVGDFILAQRGTSQAVNTH